MAMADLMVRILNVCIVALAIIVHVLGIAPRFTLTMLVILLLANGLWLFHGVRMKY